MRIVVQKFGGNCVATPADRRLIAERAAEAAKKGCRTVVVVSAMGRAGDPYATDTLIQLALDSSAGLPPRELDLLMSCGETIATVVVAGALKERGLDAVALTGAQAGIITDANFSDARILRVDPERLLRYLKEGRVAVVAGFQGVTDTGEVTTLGRGGSDTTAAALGAALGAEIIEIYTDVEGVKTADPRIVSGARTLKVLSYQEVSQMAYEGARVIHPRAVEIAMRKDIPIRILSLAGPGPGTLVTHAAGLAAAPWPDVREGRVITGVTHIPDVAQIVVTHPPAAAAGGGEAGSGPGEGTARGPQDRVEGVTDPSVKVFECMAEAGISVDLISVSPGSDTFTVLGKAASKALQVLASQGFQATATPGCAKVTVVGAGMRGVPGVMAKVVRALAGANIPILQTADSHLTISCLVPGVRMGDAIRALHREFGLDEPKDGPPPEPGAGKEEVRC